MALCRFTIGAGSLRDANVPGWDRSGQIRCFR